MYLDVLTFIVSGLIIAVAGTKLSLVADRLADRTGIGEALIGGVLLGASTSISGSTLSVLAAYDGLVELSVGNAVGGIAAQTFFLCLADIFYKKSNLEHAAATSTNILLAALLVALLSVPIVAQALPNVTIWGIHPLTILLLGGYAGGIKYVSSEKKQPMWFPRITSQTVEDIPHEPRGQREVLTALWGKFALLALLLIASGFLIERAAVGLAREFDLTHTFVGTVLTAVTTSLPELITTFAAVRRGAIALGVGGIVGGNSFDVLFVAFSDIAYRPGSIYHAMSSQQLSFFGITILMTAVLLMGLVRREKAGVANIGTESLIIGLLYIFSLVLLI